MRSDSRQVKYERRRAKAALWVYSSLETRFVKRAGLVVVY